MTEERHDDHSSAEMVDTDTRSGNQNGQISTWIKVGFIAAILLVLVGIIMTFNIPERLGIGGTAASEAANETVTINEDSTVEFSEDFSTSTGAEATVLSASDLSGAGIAALPADISPIGDTYLVEESGVGGSGVVNIAYPAGSDAAAIDLYSWDGTNWVFAPSQVDGNQIVSLDPTIQSAYVIAETEATSPLTIGADWSSDVSLAEELTTAVNQFSTGPLTLVGNGELQGEVTTAPSGDHGRFLRVTNAAGIVDSASLSAFLGNVDAQQTQIDVLINTASSGGFDGINLDYQGVSAAQAPAFSTFVSDLAQALHEQDLLLAVTLTTPQFTGSDWDSLGQDWATIGQVADIIYAIMPIDPTAYAADGMAEKFLSWATRRVDRQKLIMLLNAGAVDRLGESFAALSNEAALENFGEIQFAQGGEEITPNTAVEVFLSGNATPLEWDGASLTYKYSYEDNGQNHNVWLANPAALAQRLSLVNQFKLSGVLLRGLENINNADGYAAALNSLREGGAPPEATGAAIVWTVRDAEGNVLASESGSDLSFAWDGSGEGNYELLAEFALGNSVATLDSTTILVAEASEEDTVAEEEPDSETAVAENEETETAADPNPTQPPPSSFDPGTNDAVVNTNANVRVGPGLSFGTIAGGAQAGTAVSLIGRTSDNSWYQVILPEGQEGWIFATLLTLNSSVDIGQLEVVEVEAPVVGTGPNPPPAPAPVSGAFELGGQTAGLPVGPMQISGMTWIKRQHKWSPGNNATDVQGLISEGHNAGFKVLLSIPGQLNPSSIDFNAYVQFLGGVAALPDPPDAIEVWNEMNITREWPAGQINPTTYVNSMLKPAYTAIKAANPNILVITGAPAPTGFFGGSCGGSGCDDAPYIAGMMAAGAGSFSDCVGVHYNEGIMPPAATSGDPRGNGGHYTRYYQGMVNAYVAAGAGSLCFTELGYLSGEEWGFVPGGFLWKGAFNLTVAEHAQYLAEAVSLAANSGRVRLLIIFNVDFTTWGDDPQAGYAMIRPNGGCPACETVGNVMNGR